MSAAGPQNSVVILDQTAPVAAAYGADKLFDGNYAGFRSYISNEFSVDFTCRFASPLAIPDPVCTGGALPGYRLADALLLLRGDLREVRLLRLYMHAPPPPPRA